MKVLQDSLLMTMPKEVLQTEWLDVCGDIYKTHVSYPKKLL